MLGAEGGPRSIPTGRAEVGGCALAQVGPVLEIGWKVGQHCPQKWDRQTERLSAGQDGLGGFFSHHHPVLGSASSDPLNPWPSIPNCCRIVTVTQLGRDADIG